MVQREDPPPTLATLRTYPPNVGVSIKQLLRFRSFFLGFIFLFEVSGNVLYSISAA